MSAKPRLAGDGQASADPEELLCPACGGADAVREAGKLPRCREHDRVMVRRAERDAAPRDPFLGMVVGGGRFAITGFIGSGSMGTVYRAHQESMGRDVAVKIVRSERLTDARAVRRFKQEARTMSMLTSQYTATVFDFGEINVEGPDPEYVDGSMFLAMELLDGESLGDRIKRRGKISPREALKVMKHALASLAEAHEKGVIHRDLKPDNLVLVRNTEGEEICKVLDFGIAKLKQTDGGKGVDALETQAGTVFGTPRYMSPEQAQGKPLDARSDLYSLGVILYHMVLGRAPYTDSDAVVVMAHHIRTPPKRPSEIDPECGVPAPLEDLIMRVLSKKADERPQSASAFSAELEALSLTRPSGNASGELTAVLSRAAQRANPARTAGVLVAGLVVAAGVAWWMSPTRQAIGGRFSGPVHAMGARVSAQAETQLSRESALRAKAAERARKAAAAAASSTPKRVPRRRAKPAPKATNRGYEKFD